MPRGILLRFGLRDLLRRPLHTGLMVLGIALGVAVVVAIDLANESARVGMARSTAAVTGRSTHRIVGGARGVPQEVYERLRVEWGIRASAPVVEGYCLGLDRPRGPLRVLGVDPLADGPFRGQVGQRSLAAPGFSRFFTEPTGVLVSADLAQAESLSLGTSFRVLVDDRERSLKVIGQIVPADDAESASLSGLLIMDVGAAQRLFGREGFLSHIDLIATEEKVEWIAARLPAGVRIEAADAQAQTVSQLTDAFQLNLTALSLLALLVGMFLIYNTVMFSVVRRRQVLGTLRALGVTGGELLGLVLAETALAAALGAVLGIGLGFVLGQGTVRLVTRTINDLYFVLAVKDAPLTLSTTLKGLFLGIGAGVLAAVVPALEASRVEPVTAMRPSTLETKTRRVVPWVALLGLVSGLLGLAALGVSRGSLVGSFAGLFGIVLGLALVTPWASVWLVGGLRPLLAALFGSLGEMATRTVTRSVSRTGVAVAALMVAVSVTISVSVMIASFRDTVLDWLATTLVADLYIAAPYASDHRAPTLSPEVLDRVSSTAGVEAVETYRMLRVQSSVGEVRLAVAGLRAGRSEARFRFTEGEARDVWRRLRAGAVAVTEPFAFHHGILRPGARLVLQTDHGEEGFEVAGIFYDYTSQQGYVLVDRNVYEQHFADRSVTSIGAYLAPGQDPEKVAQAIRERLSGRIVTIAQNRALREGVLTVFDRTFAVTQALRLLAVVVACIGVFGALLALHLERTRELATLRALGLSPGGLVRLVLLESGLMGAAAGVFSWPAGVLLAWVLVHVINVRSFGWTMQMRVDPWLLVQALLISVLAALLAAVYPLLRLRRVSVSAALRQE
jgi:putative ABC transport system permease protein